MDEYHVSGDFILHPMFASEICEFSSTKHFQIIQNVDYHKEIETGSMLVTDYSSLAFDFAFLNKPVIYAQFDAKEFYENHNYKPGYFSYQQDGLGEITETVDETVAAIIRLIRTDFANPLTYQQRADAFFAFHDRHNCERVYDEIIRLVNQSVE
jgi:CDP-glycerol glycerophosphotransferase (TagB/SpsB family)